MADTERVWLVERTYSDDEQNLIILVYATPDGDRYLRKERAVTSYGGDATGSAVAIEVPVDRLASVEDDGTAARYADEAARMRERHDPDDAV